jgi:hypothetical protein
MQSAPMLRCYVQVMIFPRLANAYNANRCKLTLPELAV